MANKDLYMIGVVAIGSAQFIRTNKEAMKAAQERIDELYKEAEKLGYLSFVVPGNEQQYHLEKAGQMWRFNNEVDLLVKITELITGRDK